MRSFSPPVFKYGWWLLAAGLCALATVASLALLTQRLRAQAWPEAAARIVACEQGGPFLGWMRISVQYEYVFAGVVHHSFSGGVVGASTGARLAEEYRPGLPALCYVNPAAPERAVLRREVGLLTWILPVLFGLSVAGLIWGARKAMAQQRLADIATLYSLETGVLVPVEKQEAA